MDSAANANRELRLLGDLVRELVKLRFQAGMSDARPAAYIRDDAGRLALVVSVAGEHFEWRDAKHSHLVTDHVGAAGAIAAAMWRRADNFRPAP